MFDGWVHKLYTLSIQGPFTVKAGSTAAVTFRNVFAQTMTFQFYVDNPLFHITKPSESVRAHKDHKIVVSYDGSDSAWKAPVAGRLVVSCARSAAAASAGSAPPNIQWIYYLKGVTPDGKDAKWLRSCSILSAAAEVVTRWCCDSTVHYTYITK